MSVKVVSHTTQIIAKNEANIPVAIRFALEDMKAISEPVTPKKTGDLRDSTVISVRGKNGKIIWKKRYAIYQEEKQFKNYTTRGTGPHFAKDAAMQVYKNSKQYLRKARVIQ